jgi:hypothetical protein
MAPQELHEFRLRDAEVRCLHRFPKLFAASVCTGIISSGLMATEILQPRSFPCFYGFALLHEVDRRKAQAKTFCRSKFT